MKLMKPPSSWRKPGWQIKDRLTMEFNVSGTLPPLLLGICVLEREEEEKLSFLKIDLSLIV